MWRSVGKRTSPPPINVATVTPKQLFLKPETKVLSKPYLVALLNIADIKFAIVLLTWKRVLHSIDRWQAPAAGAGSPWLFKKAKLGKIRAKIYRSLITPCFPFEGGG